MQKPYEIQVKVSKELLNSDPAKVLESVAGLFCDAIRLTGVMPLSPAKVRVDMADDVTLGEGFGVIHVTFLAERAEEVA